MSNDFEYFKDALGLTSEKLAAEAVVIMDEWGSQDNLASQDFMAMFALADSSGEWASHNNDKSIDEFKTAMFNWAYACVLAAYNIGRNAGKEHEGSGEVYSNFMDGLDFDAVVDDEDVS